MVHHSAVHIFYRDKEAHGIAWAPGPQEGQKLNDSAMKYPMEDPPQMSRHELERRTTDILCRIKSAGVQLDEINSRTRSIENCNSVLLGLATFSVAFVIFKCMMK